MGLFRRSSPSTDALDDDEGEVEEDLEEEQDEKTTDEGDGEDTEDEEAVDEAADEEETPQEEGANEEAEGEVEEEEEPREKREFPPILPGLAKIGHRIRVWRFWTPTLLILIFLLALFIRSYFYWPAAQPDYLPPGTWLLSGNDPDYHKRAVDFLDQNHRWLAFDPLQNFPQGGPNPNPPAYETSVLLIGYLLSPAAPDTTTSVWWSMQFGGALWAALTVFPVFLVAREMFGRKAGLIAAFLLAVMAGNIERTPVGFSDHDGFTVFFIVCGFYFYIRAMEYTKNRTYVTNYRDLDSVTRGFIRFVREQRIAVLYTMMATTMWSASALAWKGFPYIYAILLAYYFFTVIALRFFRHEDPFAVGMLTMISFTLVMVITLPYYYTMAFMHWYEIFYLLWAAAALVTLFFIPTRNMPWVLILLVLAGLFAVAFVGLNLFAPDIANTIFSGAGYFSRNKLYTTIAEAQAPDVSRLVSSYGYATSLLALGGIGVMAFRLPRRWSNAYVLMLAWAAMAIYMALTAVRFMYNATPLFAILGGWMVWAVIDKTGFSLKTYRGRWGKFARWRKLRTVPVLHWLVALFLAFQVVYPNFMQGLDAGIPFETKREWDRAIYYFMPDLTDPFSIGGWTPLNDIHIFRPGPQQFDPNGNGLWYLGAFGTSYMNDYWAVGMKWLASQDRNQPEAQRPGFISWWDYGHWAMHVGEHPTAADNFQNGFEFAGNFIGAPGEDAGNSLILARYLETLPNNAKILELARKYLGDDGFAEYQKYAADPTAFTQQILDNPTKYMPRDPPVSERNAFYILVSAVITDHVSPENRIWWIRDIKQETGFELRYFAVDVRMMPFSASQTGIFYAPIILADYDKNDFVQIVCYLNTGRSLPCDNLTPREYRELTRTEIQYKPHFYDSMFTRAYLGYTAHDIPGGTFNGFPGIRASCTPGQTQSCLQNQAPMQGWNMSHWRMVERTVYFNPNATDLANHTKDWKIITDQEADSYEGNSNVTVDRQFLGLGENTGTGVTFLKYYAGAYVNGTVRTAEGEPVPNARVTVYDDMKLANPSWFGVPHGYAFADANGSFSALVPFGNVTLFASTGGGADPFQLREQVGIGQVSVPVSDDQAMRIEQDLDHDGQLDFNIHRDITAVPGGISGRAYLDKDNNSVYGKGVDETLAGAVLVANSTNSQVNYTTTATAGGGFRFDGMAPGVYNVTGTWGGHNWTALTSVSVNANQTAARDIALKPGRVAGRASDELDGNRANATIVLTDLQTGAVLNNTTGPDGTYAFATLLPGNYTLRSTLTNATPFEQAVHLDPGGALTYNFTAADTVGVNLQIFLDGNGNHSFDPGEGAANATVELHPSDTRFFNLTRVGENGTLSARYPAGAYTLRATYQDPARGAFAASLDVVASEGATWTVELLPAMHINGTVFRDGDPHDGNWSGNLTAEPTLASVEVFFESNATGERTRVITRSDGGYDAILPQDTYHIRVIVDQSGFPLAQVAFLTVDVNASGSRLDIPLVNGTRVTGKVGFDSDGSGTIDTTEQIPGANVTLRSGPFWVQVNASTAGDYTAWVNDGNWTATVRAPGYLTNASSAVMNGSNVTANVIDVFVPAALVNITGWIGFDADADGNLTGSEGFASVHLNFTAEPGAGAYFAGANATAVTNATGNFTVALPVGHYTYNFSVDRGSGATLHRYEAFDASTGQTVFHPLYTPTGTNISLNLSLRELSHLTGIVCYDRGNDGCQTEDRPAGATVTLRSGAVPTVFTTTAGGVLDGQVASKPYTLEASWQIPGGGTAKAILEVNLTNGVNLGQFKLTRLATLTVHAFNDKNLDGLENDGAEPVTGPTITFTNVTAATGTFDVGNATVELLPGRSYHYLVDIQRAENLDHNFSSVFTTVLWHAEGDYTFNAAQLVFNLPLPRKVQVSGAFFFDRNGDGRYTPGNREEPIGAFLEFRDAANSSRVVLRQEVPQTGSFEAFVALGNYTLTVEHSGFDGANASWRVNVTETPPSDGFKVNFTLKAHDVNLTGYTFLDLNRNGRMNAFESGVQVNSLKLYNATNLSDVQNLTVDPSGRYNVTLKPGTYNLYAVGAANGTRLAGIAQAAVDPVGGLSWTNVSLRQAFTIGGSASFNNTTGETHPTPAADYWVSVGNIKFALGQPAGSYNITLPDGAFSVNATASTLEFNTSMNYTTLSGFPIDFENISRDLNFTKDRRYTVEFNFTAHPDGLAQGASWNYTALVRNTGTDNATFDLTTSGGQVPGGWTYQISTDNVTLEIGESKEIWILINTSNQTRAGQNILQLRANPHNVTGLGGSIDFTLVTRQDYGIDARPSPDPATDAGSTQKYFIDVENKGNGVDKVAVTLSSMPAGYAGTVDQGAPGAEMEVQPFGTQRVTVTVTRDATAAVAPHGSSFLVSVRSVSDANNTTQDSVTVAFAYPDLRLGGAANATRVTESGGSLIDQRPLTTPGFEGALAAVALAGLAAVQARRRGRDP